MRHLLAVEQGRTGAEIVTVAPITHTPPRTSDAAIEIPAAVKKALGMDDARSWVVVDETNQFDWPGFDLRLTSRNPRRFHYGFIPPRLFERIVQAVTQNWSKGTGKPIPR